MLLGGIMFALAGDAVSSWGTMAYRWRREWRIEGMMRGLSDVMLVIYS
jgi:hypothetical protein